MEGFTFAPEIENKMVKGGRFQFISFHFSINFRRRKNNIVALSLGARWVEDVIGVIAEVKSYF